MPIDSVCSCDFIIIIIVAVLVVQLTCNFVYSKFKNSRISKLHSTHFPGINGLVFLEQDQLCRPTMQIYRKLTSLRKKKKIAGGQLVEGLPFTPFFWALPVSWPPLPKPLQSTQFYETTLASILAPTLHPYFQLWFHLSTTPYPRAPNPYLSCVLIGPDRFFRLSSRPERPVWSKWGHSLYLYAQKCCHSLCGQKERKKVRSFSVFAINVWSFSVCLQLEAVPVPFRGVTQACRPHTFLKRIKACHAIDRYVLLNCFIFSICCRRDRLTVMLGLVVIQSPCVNVYTHALGIHCH